MTIGYRNGIPEGPFRTNNGKELRYIIEPVTGALAGSPVRFGDTVTAYLDEERRLAVACVVGFHRKTGEVFVQFYNSLVHEYPPGHIQAEWVNWR